MTLVKALKRKLREDEIKGGRNVNGRKFINWLIKGGKQTPTAKKPRRSTLPKIQGGTNEEFIEELININKQINNVKSNDHNTMTPLNQF